MYTNYNRNNGTSMCHSNSDTVYQPATDLQNTEYMRLENMIGPRQNSSDSTESNNVMTVHDAMPQRATIENSAVPQSGEMVRSRTTGDRSISFTPETVTNPDFLPAYLSKFIGKWIRADFLIGSGIEQRVGILHDVGASYIIMQAIEPATLIVCDLFSLKFVTIIMDDEYGRLMLI